MWIHPGRAHLTGGSRGCHDDESLRLEMKRQLSISETFSVSASILLGAANMYFR